MLCSDKVTIEFISGPGEAGNRLGRKLEDLGRLRNVPFMNLGGDYRYEHR